MWVGMSLGLNRQAGQYQHFVKKRELGLCAGPSEAAAMHLCVRLRR